MCQRILNATGARLSVRACHRCVTSSEHFMRPVECAATAVEFLHRRHDHVKANRIGIALTVSATLCAGTAVFSQTPSSQGSLDGIAGKMGTVEVKTADLRRILDAQPPQVKKQVTSQPTDLDRLVRSELIRLVLLNEAKAKGIDKRPEVALMMERARDQALLQAYMNDVAKPPAGFPSDEDIKQAYEANKAALAVPAEFELAQIFIAVPENADKATLTA